MDDVRRDAVVSITGPQPAILRSEDDPDAPTVRQSLQKGHSQLQLADGGRSSGPCQADLGDSQVSFTAEPVLKMPESSTPATLTLSAALGPFTGIDAGIARDAGGDADGHADGTHDPHRDR
jgi:hypothetical protein